MGKKLKKKLEKIGKKRRKNNFEKIIFRNKNIDKEFITKSRHFFAYFVPLDRNREKDREYLQREITGIYSEHLQEVIRAITS